MIKLILVCSLRHVCCDKENNNEKNVLYLNVLCKELVDAANSVTKNLIALHVKCQTV